MLTPPVAIAAPLPIREFDATSTILEVANKYHLNDAHFLAVAKCESGLIPDKQSGYVHNGVREPSYGLWQIDEDFHPDIPRASSTDPYWSTDWAAQQWVLGREHEWSCYDKLSKYWQ